MRDRVERRLLGRAERAEPLVGREVLAALRVPRPGVAVEQLLALGVELDVPVAGRPLDVARIDQRAPGPLAIDPDDAETPRLAAEAHADGHSRIGALGDEAREHVAAGGAFAASGGTCWPSAPMRVDGLPAWLSNIHQSTR